MTTPKQQAAILTDEPWIGALIERLKAGAGDVYWRDQENRLMRVLRVQLDWIDLLPERIRPQRWRRILVQRIRLDRIRASHALCPE